MRIWNYEEEGINIRDGVRGTVIGGCSKGIFLSLEDGQEAFAQKWKVLVSIDSIENLAIV